MTSIEDNEVTSVNLQPKSIRQLNIDEAKWHAAGYLDGYAGVKTRFNNEFYNEGYKLGEQEFLHNGGVTLSPCSIEGDPE